MQIPLTKSPSPNCLWWHDCMLAKKQSLSGEQFALRKGTQELGDFGKD